MGANEVLLSASDAVIDDAMLFTDPMVLRGLLYLAVQQLAFRNVHRHAKQTQRLTGFAVMHLAAGSNPPLGTVACHGPVLSMMFAVTSTIQQLCDERADTPPVIGVQTFGRHAMSINQEHRIAGEVPHLHTVEICRWQQGQWGRFIAARLVHLVEILDSSVGTGVLFSLAFGAAVGVPAGFGFPVPRGPRMREGTYR